MNKFHIFLLYLLLLFGTFAFSETTYAQSSIVNPNKTYSYANMQKDIKKLEKVYPGLIKQEIIGKSEYGRNIYAVSLGKGESTVFINGSHHAREWITTNLTMNMIDKYAAAYKSNTGINGYNVKKILNDTTIWFVPMVNPDGVTLQQSGLKSFPAKDHARILKMNGGSNNFKRWKANGKGVDLNRQYSPNWKNLGGPKVPYYKNYNGPKVAAASETKAILSFIDKIDSEIAISYHSSGQIIFWKYQQTGSRYTQDAHYASKLSKITGYSLVKSKSFGGGFSDWFSTLEKKPAFTIEVSPAVGETHVPLRNYAKIWSQNASIGLYTAQEGFKLYDTRNNAASDKVTTQIKTYNKTAARLKNYYSTDITSESKLKVSRAHLSLYNKTNKEIKKQEKAIAKLPAKYRTKPNAALKTTKSYRDNSLAFMKAIQAGDDLIKTNKKLKDYLTAGKLNSATFTTYDKLVKQTITTENKIKIMFSKSVQKLATLKYVTPSRTNKKNTDYDIARYELLLDMEEQVDNRQYDEVKKNITKYKKLKSTHSYKKLETMFKNRLRAIEDQLHLLEPDVPTVPEQPTPLEDPEVPAPDPEVPKDGSDAK
ncbi:M14 family zinc carboxypeptidase [Peribacillus sp. NPDC097264]|uniref:M14 family zinc carboxypeptidase n=1 Tax=Peribacillus sp. NPDC097264 TaxID=3390616 RepID=UPI003D07399F